MSFPLYVFDAYGTLFDIHSAVARHADQVGPEAGRLSEAWRTKQLEYAWVGALSGRHEEFWTLTERALDYAIARIGGLDGVPRDALLSAYATLDAYGDVAETLAGLKAMGAKTAILSNGSPKMLASAVGNAGIGHLLDAVLSVEAVGTYKTHPRVYALVEERFGMEPARVSYQSSNRWDVAGAVAFGFRTVWVNRTEAPDEYPDLKPERTIKTLKEILTTPEKRRVDINAASRLRPS